MAINVLQKLVAELPNRQGVVVEAVLNTPEDRLEVHLFDGGVCFERLIDDVESEQGSAGVLALESLDQLWEDEACLVSPKHGKQDLGANLFEVWFVGLELLEQLVVRGEGDSFNGSCKLSKAMQAN